MTARLQKAIAAVQSLPDPQQDEIAEWLLAELESESTWTDAFQRTPTRLASMADEALAEFRAGRTEPLDLSPR